MSLNRLITFAEVWDLSLFIIFGQTLRKPCCNQTIRNKTTTGKSFRQTLFAEHRLIAATIGEQCTGFKLYLQR